jgi:hypothetical protein
VPNQAQIGLEEDACGFYFLDFFLCMESRSGRITTVDSSLVVFLKKKKLREVKGDHFVLGIESILWLIFFYCIQWCYTILKNK